VETAFRAFVRRVLFGALLVLAVVAFVLWYVASSGNSVQRTNNLKNNLGNAEHIVVALRLSADEHGDHFPDSLEALVPKYCTTEILLFGSSAGPATKLRWQYFPGGKLNDDPPVIVVRSPPNSKGDWVAGYSDGSVRQFDKSHENSRR
jgi:hypothetical protein